MMVWWWWSRWVKNGDGDDDMGRKSREGDKETRREREKERKREKTKKTQRRERERRERETPNTCALALLKSKSVICIEVKADVFKTFAESAFVKKKKAVQRLDSLVRAPRRVQRDKKKMHASGLVNLRRCSKCSSLTRTYVKHLWMNPVSGARLFNDFWVESCHRTHNRDAELKKVLKLSLSQYRFPFLQKWKSSGLKFDEHGGHVRSWISRSFKNVLERRLLCDGTLSSCLRQLDVSVSRRVMQCGKHTSSSFRM